VQEALTNVIKHAGPASAEVIVRYGADRVEVEVRDDGHTPAGSTSGGNGLIGMRERVAMLGGELQTGARRSGGFAVVARLPITGPA
jgi:signal transduction histidine kinase